jgi:hypothetical protein
MLIAALVVYVIARLLSAEAARIQSRANPDTRFPVWRDVPGFRRPFKSLVTYTAQLFWLPVLPSSSPSAPLGPSTPEGSRTARAGGRDDMPGTWSMPRPDGSDGGLAD